MIIQDDVIHWAETYEGEPFHAMLLDPPYHLVSINKRFSKPGSKPAQYGKDGAFQRASKGFMQTDWDGLGEDGQGIAFRPETWATLAQHLYPGAFIMAFASSRGWHRMAVAMEDAGLILHPSLFMFGWCYLSGFPKATRVKGWYGTEAFNGHRYGGQMIKPAIEPIIVAQVPYQGRPVENIVETGAGALWIDGGRIPTDESIANHRNTAHNKIYGKFNEPYHPGDSGKYTHDNGRWPSNLLLHCSCSPTRPDKSIHDESCAVTVLDGQSGETGNGYRVNPSTNKTTWFGATDGSHIEGERGYDDSGPASRMFYTSDWAYEVAEQLVAADSIQYEPKASSLERSIGLKVSTVSKNIPHATYGDFKGTPEHATNMNGEQLNPHPTVKPISLTKYLATLLLPPAQYAPRRILIPFCGVASEYIGAMLAGWEEIVGIERETNYVEIARERAKWWGQWPGWGQTDVDKILASDEEEKQLRMF